MLRFRLRLVQTLGMLFAPCFPTVLWLESGQNRLYRERGCVPTRIKVEPLNQIITVDHEPVVPEQCVMIDVPVGRQKSRETTNTHLNCLESSAVLPGCPDLEP